MKRPVFLAKPYWTAQRLAILIGFVLTLLGSLGSEFYVSPVLSQSSQLDQVANQASADIETLKNAQAQYLMFQQQGALIFALNAGGAASTSENQKTVTANLYALSLLDRSTAMRTMIGQLAIAGLTDYKADSEKYTVLIDAARSSFSLDTYKSVDDFEKETMAHSTAQMASLQQKLLTAEREKSVADGLADQRKLILLMAVTLGSTFLLAANLLTTRKKDKPIEQPMILNAAGSDDRVAALRLVDIAIAEARSGISKGSPGD